MISFPNCKINLGLFIENKRTDGFHNIKTVFFPLPLRDVLEVIESDNNSFSITLSGIPINDDKQTNLCVKAYKLLKSDFNLPPVKIQLFKAIPHGAGLGGGSSDAAFTIKILNNKFKLSLSNKQMEFYAAKLGSDCAFFIENKVVIAKGKGEIFENIEFSLDNYFIVLIKPNSSVNTKDAYQWVKPRNTEIDIKKIIKQPIENWKEILINDFEVSIFNKYPEIASIKNLLYKSGAIYSSMSGSGASVFGIFKSPPPNLSLPKNSFYWISKI
ncbi:MAG: 4-(cytidine 5'-diphospho)-2-C-methyl-D-erythritol kinase [Bacteroidales bacterium]